MSGYPGTVLFSQRHTFLEVSWSIFTRQLTLVCVPLLRRLGAGPGFSGYPLSCLFYKWLWVKGILDTALGRGRHRWLILEMSFTLIQVGGGLCPDRAIGDCWGIPDLPHSCPCQISWDCSKTCLCQGLGLQELYLDVLPRYRGLGSPGRANCVDYGQCPARAVVGSYKVGPM